MEDLLKNYDNRMLLSLPKRKTSALFGGIDTTELCASLLTKYEESRSVSSQLYFTKVVSAIVRNKAEIINEPAFSKLIGKCVYDRSLRFDEAYAQDGSLKKLNAKLLDASAGDINSLQTDGKYHNQETRSKYVGQASSAVRPSITRGRKSGG